MIWRYFLALMVVVPAWATDSEFFESKVRPILADNCYTCHTDAAMGGLRLDSLEAVLKGGKSGPVVMPGKPEESVLIQAVQRTHARLKMPPTAALAASDVDVLVEWVKRGVPWGVTLAHTGPAGPRFWAFQKVTEPAVPQVKNKAWVKTPVDAFVLAQLESKGIAPAKPADRGTWLRRVTLDLTGLPPTPEDVDAFLKDTSPEAYRKVVDRLLESPHYGERWARYWLDLARYSDGLLSAGVDTPLPNAYRYRDWVVDAFNKDLPYDRFVKAQIAADLMPEDQRKDLIAGLGFQALGGNPNDQVDVTTKAFLGLTVGCAQCHDHKYDPIPTRDYYSLLGVFSSSVKDDYPLVDPTQVKLYTEQKKKIDQLKEALEDYLVAQQKQLVDLLARSTARYLVAAWKIGRGEAADTAGLDQETLDRWVNYLKTPDKEHPYLKPWLEAVAQNPSEDQACKAAEQYQKFVLELIDEAKEVEDKNYVAFGGKKGMKTESIRQYTNIVALPVLKFYQWRELAAAPYNIDGHRMPAGIYYYSPKELDRWLGGHAMQYVVQVRSEIAALEKDLPPMYPFLHAMKEGPKPADARVAIRGDTSSPGEVAPRRFLSALCDGEAKRFTNGSGRLELADAIASPQNPLTARVVVNRLWQHHFGQGIVKTPSNFGLNGERPTHPQLLDYLAVKLIESGWSLKGLHRLILLSSTYGLSTVAHEANLQKDPENKLLWRANVRPRLDLEALRDSVLAVSGKLDPKLGGPSEVLSETNYRRSLYLTVSRTRLDATMALFDFPDPNATTDERPVTTGPLQALFFLNSKFVADQAKALEERLTREAGPEAGAKIERAYRLLYGRRPDAEELRLGLKYVAPGGSSWQQYLQALLGSAEFTSVN